MHVAHTGPGAPAAPVPSPVDAALEDGVAAAADAVAALDVTDNAEHKADQPPPTPRHTPSRETSPDKPASLFTPPVSSRPREQDQSQDSLSAEGSRKASKSKRGRRGGKKHKKTARRQRDGSKQRSPSRGRAAASKKDLAGPPARRRRCTMFTVAPSRRGGRAELVVIDKARERPVGRAERRTVAPDRGVRRQDVCAGT